MNASAQAPRENDLWRKARLNGYPTREAVRLCSLGAGGEARHRQLSFIRRVRRALWMAQVGTLYLGIVVLVAALLAVLAHFSNFTY